MNRAKKRPHEGGGGDEELTDMEIKMVKKEDKHDVSRNMAASNEAPPDPEPVASPPNKPSNGRIQLKVGSKASPGANLKEAQEGGANSTDSRGGTPSIKQPSPAPAAATAGAGGGRGSITLKPTISLKRRRPGDNEPHDASVPPPPPPPPPPPGGVKKFKIAVKTEKGPLGEAVKAEQATGASGGGGGGQTGTGGSGGGDFKLKVKPMVVVKEEKDKPQGRVVTRGRRGVTVKNELEASEQGDTPPEPAPPIKVKIEKREGQGGLISPPPPGTFKTKIKPAIPPPRDSSTPPPPPSASEALVAEVKPEDSMTIKVPKAPKTPPSDSTQPPAAEAANSEPVAAPPPLKEKELAPKGPPIGNPAGRNIIKTGLRGDQPMVFIRHFQESNGLQSVPEAGPALELLDMLGMPRVQLYRGLLDNLKQKLEERIEKCNNAAQLENLLSSSFPYISIPELKAIPMRVITKLKEIKDLPPQFLRQLIARPSLLSDLPLPIKQQAWAADRSLFDKAIAEFVQGYVTNRTVLLPAFDFALVRTFSGQKRRDENPCLTQIITYVGQNTELESSCYRYLSSQYRQGDSLHCTLLADLNILLAHSRSGRTVSAHKFTTLARTLEDTVKEGQMDMKAVINLQSNLRAVIVTCDALARASSQKETTAGLGNRNLAALAKVPSLDKALVESINFLRKQDHDTKYFHKPVVEEYPQVKDAYLKVIKEPMDLETIRVNIKQHKYTSFEDFNQHVELIFYNCMVFNLDNSPYHTEADRQRRKWIKYRQQHFKDVDLKMALEKKAGGLSKMGPGPEKEDTPKNLDVPTPLAPREKIEGDLFGQAVMMLADPFVVNAICRSLSRKLEEVAKARSLPKDHPVVPSLLQLLHLALSARGMLAPSDKGGACFIPKPEESYGPLMRGILPCWMEVTSYLTLKSRYQATGWKNAPQEEKAVQAGQNEATERLFKQCKKQPSPLLIRLLQQWLIESLAKGEDARAELLLAILTRLYDYCRRKGLQIHTLDQQGRQLWSSLASASALRTQGKVAASSPSLEAGLRDSILSLYLQELPHTTEPPFSWLHEHLVRLMCDWSKKNVLKSAEVRLQVENVVKELGGGLRAVWDQPAFAPIREQYDKLMILVDKDKSLQSLVLGPEPEAVKEEKKEEEEGGGEGVVVKEEKKEEVEGIEEVAVKEEKEEGGEEVAVKEEKKDEEGGGEEAVAMEVEQEDQHADGGEAPMAVDGGDDDDGGGEVNVEGPEGS